MISASDSGQQYVYNGSVITVPAGQQPPPGALKMSGGGAGNSLDTGGFDFQDALGGLSSSAFTNAANGSKPTPTTIPVWRDRQRESASSNQIENKFKALGTASPEQVRAEIGGGLQKTLPAQFTEDDAVTQFATILN